MELKQFGIDVVVVQPGLVLTEWNGIAREKLNQVSGSTAYGSLAKKHIQMLETADKQGAHPLDIARVILKATTAREPRTRYVAGRGAKIILFLRRVLSDKMFDRVMLGTMR
jgi:NAD(P)-dependent dehydrogenase (short-subunit alcohol dehydrogenase family)